MRRIRRCLGSPRNLRLTDSELSRTRPSPLMNAGLTCGSIFGPVDTLGQWPFGYRGSHEEDEIFRRADGQDPARGGQGVRLRGGQEAWGQRGHDLRLAQALWAARGGGCEAAQRALLRRSLALQKSRDQLPAECRTV